MFEATKKLIEHCKHLGFMADIFARPLYESAEKEIAQIESQLTPVVGDGATPSNPQEQGDNKRLILTVGKLPYGNNSF
jgi:hypothetical protein